MNLRLKNGGIDCIAVVGHVKMKVAEASIKKRPSKRRTLPSFKTYIFRYMNEWFLTHNVILGL